MKNNTIDLVGMRLWTAKAVIERTAEKLKKTKDVLAECNTRSKNEVAPIVKGSGEGQIGSIVSAGEVTPMVKEPSISGKSLMTDTGVTNELSFPSFSLGLTQEFGEQGLDNARGDDVG
ncbi:hypothetical protein L6452_30937 [Arctium lappa]|uniref:Uncharacterized protein n=1 Tax=Arctium lappa TaxID=4217 RepID=A0ACB8ZKJ0_ARCLA|nr:hypothetical protein L6452_30937 [Arctium lappa]